MTCPFRAYLHLRERRRAARGARRGARAAPRPAGKLVFDVFTPSRGDIEETHGRWIEREPGIDERADWDLDAQTLTLSVRGPAGASTMTLWWLEPARWNTLLAEARLRGACVLRLVRPAAVRGRRGQRLDRLAKMIRANCDKSFPRRC